MPEVWLVDIGSRTVEVWTGETARPRELTEAIPWRVGERSLEIALAEVFRGVR